MLGRLVKTKAEEEEEDEDHQRRRGSANFQNIPSNENRQLKEKEYLKQLEQERIEYYQRRKKAYEKHQLKQKQQQDLKPKIKYDKEELQPEEEGQQRQEEEKKSEEAYLKMLKEERIAYYKQRKALEEKQRKKASEKLKKDTLGADGVHYFNDPQINAKTKAIDIVNYMFDQIQNELSIYKKSKDQEIKDQVQETQDFVDLYQSLQSVLTLDGLEKNEKMDQQGQKEENKGQKEVSKNKGQKKKREEEKVSQHPAPSLEQFVVQINKINNKFDEIDKLREYLSKTVGNEILLNIYKFLLDMTNLHQALSKVQKFIPYEKLQYLPLIKRLIRLEHSMFIN